MFNSVHFIVCVSKGFSRLGGAAREPRQTRQVLEPDSQPRICSHGDLCDSTSDSEHEGDGAWYPHAVGWTGTESRSGGIDPSRGAACSVVFLGLHGRFLTRRQSRLFRCVELQPKYEFGLDGVGHGFRQIRRCADQRAGGICSGGGSQITI